MSSHLVGFPRFDGGVNLAAIHESQVQSLGCKILEKKCTCSIFLPVQEPTYRRAVATAVLEPCKSWTWSNAFYHFFLHLVLHLCLCSNLMAPLLSSLSRYLLSTSLRKMSHQKRTHTNAHLHNCTSYICTYKPSSCGVTIDIPSMHLCKASTCICVCSDPAVLLTQGHYSTEMSSSRKNLAFSCKVCWNDGLQLQSLFIDLNFQGKIRASHIALAKWWIIKKIWRFIYFSSTSEIFAPEFLLLRIKFFLLSLVYIVFHFRY